MIKYFTKGFKLLIRAEIKQRGRELDSFKELVKKTIDDEAKAVFNPCFYARDIDQHYLSSSRSIFFTTTKSSGNSIKDFKTEKS